MNVYKDFAKKLGSVLDKENIKVNEYMKNHTSFKVGGSVDILVTPTNIEEIIEVIKLCKADRIPFFVMGNGSNLLIKDGGIRGVVIKLEKLNHVEVNGNEIKVESGVLMKDLSKAALEARLTGLEFICGIPGTVGGAIAMNAGAYNGEIKDVIDSAVVLDEDGKILTLTNRELELGYRTSSVLKRHYIALSATFILKNGNYDEIKAIIDDLTRRREEKQPLEYASAGSTFKRPTGYFAGKLIQDSGLKGYSVGDAQVSEKHSGFVINKGTATAKDVLAVIAHVQKVVKEKFSVELETEVRIMGEDN
ncbi:UDP-N-acetylmuramate dehydrogenase [Clostridium cellulovorans]|uniref:UDP-N-acetylenolpyruvoylglucosamine reductase n=1 Tax=Clostridium cellulovorans (strain ATCC 35296 / DSM 3052 / OCM 3 / 743B) TaxID=573061 RepID=D9SQ87_CLOC7|nr:UDP-N-acetylmuramate dehydrogenase [Clostridium cellulovorans]ADL50154.1 UDP-N-acetylenolpyruvoylglucosamine reductase [Clostridium cellulovorans 743B]